MSGLPVDSRPVAQRRVRLDGWLRLGIASLGLMLMTYPAVSSAGKRIRPLSREAISQAWLGLSEDELYAFRLVLSLDGMGQGGYVFGDEAPKMFEISSWRYQGDHIEMIVAAPDQGVADIERLAGNVTGVGMEITVIGRGWDRRLFLRREGDLVPKWKKLKAAMSLGHEEPQSRPVGESPTR